MNLSFDASELNGLSHSFSQAPEKAATMASQVVRATSFRIEGDAKIFAPVDTGHLEGSIGVDVIGPMEAVIGPAANYGGFVELGTSRMAPQPYLGPATERHRDGFTQAMEQVALRAFQ